MFLFIKNKRDPVIRLARVQETTKGNIWIFDFVDPVHKFGQSIIMLKVADVGAMEACYEKLWETWSRRIREEDWQKGEANVLPILHGHA